MAPKRRIPLSTKIILLGCSVALIMAAINVYTIPYLADTINNEKRLKTRHLVESAATLVGHYVALAKSGDLKTEEAKVAAMAAVKDLRYEKSDYFWINDFGPRMIMHPIKPALDGKDLSGFKDPDGKFLFVEFVKTARSQGAGFVDYLWPKPGFEEPVPKISYVQSIPEWSWIIGSGIYIDDVRREIRTLAYLILGLIAAIFIVALIISWIFGRSLTRPMVKMVTTLSQGSEEIGQASAQLNDSSQGLAEGSSEQAASLEEISSSLEELSSLTRSTADNSQNADKVMLNTKETISQAGQEMDRIAGSMTQIAEAGQEIGKIVKSIDEIAFQTNLLALNAAVEAARAGEAGAGFAVVADEVRSLALRAAEASRSTQSLVEDTVQRINQGSEIVERTKAGFSDLITSSTEAAELVSEIATASNEQAQGISQINQAITQVDRVVQSTAATAQESASASAEMNSQVGVINRVVGTLTKLVGIRKNIPRVVSDYRAGSARTETPEQARMLTHGGDDSDDF